MAENRQSASGGAVTADELVARLRGLTRAAESLLARGAEQNGLGSSEFVALIRAADAGGTTGAEIARSLRMRSGSVTSLADRLEARGLIERRPHPSDRRLVVLHATRRGKAIVRRAIGPLLSRLTAIAEEFGAEERATIQRFLDGVDQALREADVRPAPRHRGADR